MRGRQHRKSNIKKDSGGGDWMEWDWTPKKREEAQEQYKSLLTGLQAGGRVKVSKVQQVVFIGGTCGSFHVESFNRNMKKRGSLSKWEGSLSKWDPIRKKLVRRLLEEQDKVLRSYLTQKDGA